ncbi:MAG TPA: hypothetical protein VE398_16505 [Acidobacteriota bacterium]|nr:hypothetical protein [Acidobacteriota bacterium]
MANGKPLKDFVEPCYSISAVEQIGSQLWLGTRSDGEYGDYPAEGIVIQSLDGERKIGQISSRDGLTGDLVRAIRRSPIDSLIWVATNQGVNAIASNLKIEKSIYFYQDFDPATGNPTFLISPTPHETPMIVEFARQLNLRDYKAFHDAWRSIPAKAANKFIIGLQDSLYSPENAMPGREAFAPSETSTLVPFFIEASRSPDNKTKALALGALCAMNDPRAVARFVELRSASQQGHGGFESYFIPRCLDKYAVFGLLSKNDTGGLARKLKADTEAALNTISTQRMDAYPPLPLMETVVKNAVSMKKISDPSGMNLINAYFKASDGNNRDALLYGYVGQNMMYENDIWLAMVEGLQKFHTADIARGCAYFDMRWNFMPRRYDAAVAKAILTGVSHINSPRSCTGHITITVAPDSRISLLDSCTGAFKSQLDDPATKKLFVEKYYGTLSALEKALADQMARGQSPATIH